MNATQDTTRIFRMAAWIWLGFLVAMALMDFALYAPQVQRMLAQSAQVQQPLGNTPGPVTPQPQTNPQNGQPRISLTPVLLFYAANGLVALSFLAFTHWSWAQKQLGRAFYPLLLLAISTAPIVINVMLVPRFPPGPLANAEGMALRQLPVLFVALALIAWRYEMPHVIFFSIATTGLELGLIYLGSAESRNIFVFLFIAIIRTISFIAVGVFISLLVARLREQSESLRQANANLAHYASTLEQLTVSRERNRLARELHDTLAHSLTALSVSLETAKAYFDIDKEKTRELLDKSLESTRKGVEETRRALKALRSSALEDMGLGLAIKRLAESAASRLHLDLELALPDPMPSLSPDVEQTIYRIAQEAVENITNHARAKRISIQLTSNHHTVLTIKDDGSGFDATNSPSGHFGLVGMRERAELAGGTLTVQSAGGRGTTIVLTI